MARHLAVLQSNHLKSLEEKVVVKEWHRSSDPSVIKYELEGSKICKILILTQITPQYLLGYNLSDIQIIARKTNHFVIATTELPFAAWHLVDFCRVWWYPIADKDVEDCQRLINTRSHEEALSDWYYRQLDSKEQLLAIGLSLFDNLFDDQFFSALEAVIAHSWKNRDSSLQSIDYCDLDKLRGYFDFIETESQQAIVKIRYPKQRLTCLKIAWTSHRRQILSALPILVKLVKGTVEGVNRELYSSQIRQEKIRQTISEAISGIGLISRLSAGGSRKAVEASLIQLATSKELKVQAVAAQSIAAWRDKGNEIYYMDSQREVDIDKELFSILEGWQTDEITNRLYKSTSENKPEQEPQAQPEQMAQEETETQAENKDQERQEKPADYIRATLAITVGYASQYDPKNALSEYLYERFRELMYDTNSLVRNRFESYTLPAIVIRHFSKVQNLFQTMILLDENLLYAVAVSLSRAYRYNPSSVVALLKDWHNVCLKGEFSSNNQEELKILINALTKTIAITIGSIFELNHDRYSKELTIELAFLALLELLKFEKGEENETRILLLQSLCLLIRKKFNEIGSKNLEKLFHLISPEESDESLLEALKTIYLEQRSELTGGDVNITVDGIKYPVWFISEDRKLTSIEIFLLSLAKDEHSPQCQKVVARSYMGFIKDFEDKEKIAVSKIIRESFYDDLLAKENQRSYQLSRHPYCPKQRKDGPYSSIVIPWIITRKAKTYFRSVSHLLPEVWKYKFPWNSTVNFFLEKLKSKEDEELIKISQLLGRGMRSAFFFFGTAFFFLVFAVLSILILGTINQNKIRSAISKTDSSNEISPEQIGPKPLPEDNSQNEAISSNNPFTQHGYPLDACGDSLPTDFSAYPVNIYPVSIGYSDDHLSQIKLSFCRDAFIKTKTESGQMAIQVASFLSREKANLFKDFIGENFPEAEVGSPSQFDAPLNSSKPVKINKQGIIQFAEDATKTKVEHRLAPFTLDRYTFVATGGQETVIAVRSLSGEANLAITSPSQDYLRVSEKSQGGVISWIDSLPMDGVYTIDIFSQEEESSYRLFLEITP